MRIYKITILFLLIPIFSFAQQDSINENVKRFVDAFYKNNCTIHNHTAFYKKDSVFFENVIYYLSNTIKTDSNYWKTKETIELLDYFAYIPYQNIKYKATNYILDIYNYPGIRCSNQKLSWNGIYDFSADDFDEKAKHKISKLLAGYYSKDDFNRHKAIRKKELLKGYNTDIEYSWYWLKYVEKQAKKTNKNKKYIRDSIYSLWLKRDLPKFKLNKCYPKELLYLIGKNYMYEFIPQIKTLMDTAKGFPVYFSKLVLARMGEEPYLTEMLDSLRKFEYIPTYTFIQYKAYAEQVAFISHNPESINIFKKWMDTKYLYQQAPLSCFPTNGKIELNKYIIEKKTDTIVKPFNGRFYPANVWAAYELANLVYDFPEKYKTFPNTQYYYDVVNYTKKWFNENQENIKLNNLSYFTTYTDLSVLSVNVNSKTFKEQYEKELERAKKELELYHNR